MAQGSAAPLPIAPANETADITAMFLEHPKGYEALLKLLTSSQVSFKEHYDRAALAAAMTTAYVGTPPAYHHGCVASTDALIGILQKIQTGKLT